MMEPKHVQYPYSQLIEYPAGSGDLWDIPLQQEEPPEGGWTSLTLVGSSVFQAIVPTGHQVLVRVDNKDAWMSIDRLERLLSNYPNRVYVKAAVLYQVEVEAESVTGTRAESTPVSYTLDVAHYLSLSSMEVNGPTILPVYPITRETPIHEGCPCLFTMDPSCGRRLLYTLEKV